MLRYLRLVPWAVLVSAAFGVIGTSGLRLCGAIQAINSFDPPLHIGKSFISGGDTLDRIADEVRKTVPRSVERVGRVRELPVASDGPVFDESTAATWRLRVAHAKLEVTKDITVLAEFSGVGFPAVARLREGLDAMLRAELRLWEAVDRFVDFRSDPSKASQSDARVYKELENAALEHFQELSRLSGLALAADRDFRESYEAAMEEGDQALAAIRQMQTDLTLGSAGLALGTVLLAVVCGLFYVLSRRPRTPTQRRIIVP